jgi:uncharacterized protein (TIGR02444 family)
MTMLQAAEFWTFSLNLYAQRGVKPCCLVLQDEFKLNVNILLLSCYLNRLNILLPAKGYAALSKGIKDSESQLRAMRKKRRKSKGTPAYRDLLQWEIQLENQQQQEIVTNLNRQQLQHIQHRQRDNLQSYVHSRYRTPPVSIVKHLTTLRELGSAGETRQENAEEDVTHYEK